MRFDTSKPVKIVMLGSGGSGGHIAPHLYRLLYSLNRPVRFIIVDGDVVEEKNLVRQNFSHAELGENKAKALAERYSAVFGLVAEYVPEYIESEEKLQELVEPQIWRENYSSPIVETVILIGAVDNNKSRKLCDTVFQKAKHLIYIDSGNGEFSGQVVCGVRANGRTTMKPVAKLYPEILENTDKFPTELSCAEAAISAPQSITANVTAAAIVVNYVYNIVCRGCLNAKYTTFSTTTTGSRPEISKQRKRKNHE